jgi:hypothetical protein
MNPQNRPRWNLCRFIRTLTYFEVFPLLNWVQGLFSGRPQDNLEELAEKSNMGVVLVAGATGGVGKRVIRRSLTAGKKVRGRPRRDG